MLYQLIATVRLSEEPSDSAQAYRKQTLAVGTSEKLRAESHRWNLVAKAWRDSFNLEFDAPINLELKPL